MNIPVLTLRDLLARDPLCEIARLEAEETGEPGLLAAWLALLEGEDADQAMAAPLGRRLTACDLASEVRRKLPDEDPSAYCDAILHGYDALIRALALPMPPPLHDLGVVLADPAASASDRIAAVLSRDPTAAWTSHALAFGPHPDDEGRFSVVPHPAPLPDSFAVIDRETGALVLTRENQSDARTIAAILMAFPEIGGRLARIRTDLDRVTDDPISRAKQRERWLACWQGLGERSERWCRDNGIAQTPWTRPRYRVA